MGNTLNIAIIRLVREAIHGRGARELSKVIRVRYERGAFRPIDYVEFNEEEFEIVVVKRTFRGFREESGKYSFEVDRDVVEEFAEERR